MLDIEKYKYIRLNSGEIAKVEKIRKLGNGMTFFTDIGIATMVDNIKSHSKNIIDLISPRDFVNTEYVVYVSEKDKKVYTELDNEISENEILNILTREMYEQNCYKVGVD